MRLALLLLVVVLLLGGCTRTIYVPYALPPTLVGSVVTPYLEPNSQNEYTNDELYEYALQCRAELRQCDTRMTIIREMQETK
jgi:hypothetical protein